MKDCNLSKCIKRNKTEISIGIGFLCLILYTLNDLVRAIFGRIILNRITLGSLIMFITTSAFSYFYIARTETYFKKEDYSLMISILAFLTSIIAIIQTIN